MRKRRKMLIVLLAVFSAIAINEMVKTKEVKTALCISLLGPSIIENAQISVSEGQITVTSEGSTVSFTLPVGACVIMTERQ